MAQVIKMNAKKLSNSAATLNAALDAMENYGKLAQSGDTARYDAAEYYGLQVKEKVATLDDAEKFVGRYLKGFGRKVSDGSKAAMVSTFKSFGHEKVFPRLAEIKAAILKRQAEVATGPDLYASAYQINSKLKKAEKPIVGAAFTALVNDICRTTKEKNDAKKAAEAAEAIKNPPAPEKAADPIEEAKVTLGASADMLMTGKLTKAQKAALEAVKLAFKL